MEYNDNRLFDELKQIVNNAAFIWLIFMTVMSLFIGMLCLCHLLPATALCGLLWFIPTGIGLCIVVRIYHKKAGQLAKKQQISIMAYHAKQVLDSFQTQFPDTFISDCRIKMRFLAKRGIDVDSALIRLNNNIEAYNELVLSFLKESDRREDELYDLMQADTLMDYGAKAHLLRVKANELGIVNLTDTAFFHEIEAYAGGLDIVQNNWKKLSFELDETYDILSEYIKSIGLKDDAIDKDGNHITFKKWGEQLQEAFHALETYDTIKAKSILSELNKYQFDSDITDTIQDIITSIDDMMAN